MELMLLNLSCFDRDRTKPRTRLAVMMSRFKHRTVDESGALQGVVPTAMRERYR